MAPAIHLSGLVDAVPELVSDVHICHANSEVVDFLRKQEFTEEARSEQHQLPLVSDGRTVLAGGNFLYAIVFELLHEPRNRGTFFGAQAKLSLRVIPKCIHYALGCQQKSVVEPTGDL